MAATDHDLVGSGLGERQDSIVLEQDLRLAHGLAGDCAVGGGANLRSVSTIGLELCKQTQGELLGQDARHGVVDTRLGNAPGIDFVA